MKASSNRILTTHVGSLPRPDDLIAANRSREAGETCDETMFQERLRAGVAQVVQHQKGLGIDIPGDGEFGKSMGHRVNFGAWMSYAYHRLGGLDLAGPDMHDVAPRRSSPGQPVLTSFADRRDRARFAAAYADPEFWGVDGPSASDRPGMRCSSELHWWRCDQGRHCQLQGRAQRRGRGRRLYDFDCTWQYHADGQRLLQDLRGVPVRRR